ncbi:SDR family NAD(P)-dependent oxidoreductase [Streptomyces rhizosphaericus]|uniref:SDR family oxidoreductase n=1 Tax=Streptomyces rhizosphaericus TaxID=114699 RepID=A0A6G4AIB3_9ACTN|nr:SDR family NAD(P)-dependent oxidoreductase [Streptomyces rhizosphaericus]NEW72978.1 SDR family oxidoreductase [Streptomyces rhizosphaericus]
MSLNGSVALVTGDLGDPSAAAGVDERAAGELGPVDVLVNNAATVEPLGPSGGLGPAAWDASFRLNVITPVALCNAVPPRMTAAGQGRIVNVSSGVVARPASMIGGNVYVATKAALEARSLNLAAELDGYGSHGERLPSGNRRHCDAGHDPPEGRGPAGRTRVHRLRAQSRARQTDHPGAIRTLAGRPTGRRRIRTDLGRL